jgi:hypothetical protein
LTALRNGFISKGSITFSMNRRFLIKPVAAPSRMAFACGFC